MQTVAHVGLRVAYASDMSVGDDSLELDLLAASLRVGLCDLGTFVESLAAKLEEALGSLVTRRAGPRRGCAARSSCARSPSRPVATGSSCCASGADNGSRPRRARVSGGIVLKTEPLDIDAWLASLTDALASEASRNERTRQALRAAAPQLKGRGLNGIPQARRWWPGSGSGSSAQGRRAGRTGPDVGMQQAGAPQEAPHSAAYRAGSLEGLPDSGRERIERMRQDVARGFFTSDLSVNEFLLVKEAGFEPLGLVLGSSIYHIGFQQAMWNQSQEMGVLTQAMYHARELAMTRMEEEADQLGADGVVGVRLKIGRYAWGADMAEFVAVGTAVKHREGELHRAPDGRPFTSDLSGQDFSTLLRAGYRPGRAW